MVKKKNSEKNNAVNLIYEGCNVNSWTFYITLVKIMQGCCNLDSIISNSISTEHGNDFIDVTFGYMVTVETRELSNWGTLYICLSYKRTNYVIVLENR